MWKVKWPRLHIGHPAKLYICPIELHSAKINPEEIGRNWNISGPQICQATTEHLPKILVDFDPINLNWASEQLCHVT